MFLSLISFLGVRGGIVGFLVIVVGGVVVFLLVGGVLGK